MLNFMFKAKNHRFGFFIGDMMYQFLSQALLNHISRVSVLFCLARGKLVQDRELSPAIKKRVSETSEELSNKDQRVNLIKFTHA